MGADVTPRANLKQELALHDALAAVMSDVRFNDGRPHGPEIRTFIVAHLWAMFERPKDKDARWQRTMDLVGFTHERYVGQKHYRIKQVFAADAPRYEPPGEPWRHALCEAVMLRGPRAGEPCGKGAAVSFRVTEPSTGEWRIQGWCTRHRSEAEPLRRQEARGRVDGFPDPTPNVGGLLPGYIRATNWPDLYAWAQYGWKPPKIGIDANDWPVLARVEAARSALHAIAGDGETTDIAPPRLRLVTA